ncbi:DEAD-domain-containing protein [Serendipita vermifera]|nr:DEAD-domain-containing protein [Serendipita vermifera]
MADLVLNISYDSPPSQNALPSIVSSKTNPSRKRKRTEPSHSIDPQRHVDKKRRTQSIEKENKSQPSSSKRPTRGVVSSLFTSNPSITNLKISEDTEQVTLPPSNAPLTDSSTFEGLGLSPLLINHLKAKMNIQKPTMIQRASLPYLLKTYGGTLKLNDVFIQSQTGSGKTLSYLLPIIQDLLPLSSLSYIDRSIGTLAIVIAPTRELAKQISDVLEELLKLRLRENEEIPEADEEHRRARWLVSGLLTGGSTKTHEKAKIRKGLPILVATPGRLLDHLQNTTAFNVGKCRWLVLDEADRLMELGFEETIRGILKGLDGRRKLAMKAAEQGQRTEIGGWEWRERRTVLCSATIREDVQKLAGSVLKQPVVIKSSGADSSDQQTEEPQAGRKIEAKFAPPSQLTQKYIVTPLKLRLVTLVALLRTLLNEKGNSNRGISSKIIVFLSCTDSVDFHWSILGGTRMTIGSEEKDGDPLSSIAAQSPLLPGAVLYRLHGSLPLSDRLSSLQGFSRTLKASMKEFKGADVPSTILFCTSVASRGLDLPQVQAVIQYDLPTEGGATEYIHRVGRTARAGKGGEAWAFVCPSEVEWVPWVEQRMSDKTSEDATRGRLASVDNMSILREGFGGKGKEFESRATEVQLAFERWVLNSKANSELAMNGFRSHLRAYATHPADEKHIFHVKNLHSGHMAKAFGLRDAPSNLASKKPSTKVPSTKRSIASRKFGQTQGDSSSEEDRDVSLTEKRMKEVVRSQGRLTKKGGVLMSTGANEFQVASGELLSKLSVNA